MLVASDEATFGSFIRNAERILPSSSGSHHSLMCSGEPYFSSVSMLPVSGAEQLKTSGAQRTRPMISQSGAYSRFVRARRGVELVDPRHRLPALVALDMGFPFVPAGIDVLLHERDEPFAQLLHLG